MMADRDREAWPKCGDRRVVTGMACTRGGPNRGCRHVILRSCKRDGRPLGEPADCLRCLAQAVGAREESLS